MPQHQATIHWTCQGPSFAKGQYSREHTWTFDGGVTVAASPSPAVVPTPWSNPAGVDPEEALVAAAASCHMMTFLWLAGKAGWRVAQYDDTAIGHLAKNAAGAWWISEIVLHPIISYEGPAPDAAALAALHEQAHHTCFIANSLKSTIRVAAPPTS